MKVRGAQALRLMLIFLSLVNVVSASEESFTEQFLGSPLLVLTAIIIIDIIALVYRKIRK
ncbi:MAG: hypothetical protein ACUVUF_05380 [Candidatus Bathycorpusculaceae bacterium]